MTKEQEATLGELMTQDDSILPPQRIETLYNVILQLDRQQEESHGRLRSDLSGCKTTVESNYHHFDDQVTVLRSKIERLEAATERPIDAMKLVLSTRAIISLVGGCILVCTLLWSLRADLHDISTQVTAQKEASAAAAKLEEEQMGRLRDSINVAQRQSEETKRNYELLRFEFQALKETVLKGRNQ